MAKTKAKEQAQRPAPPPAVAAQPAQSKPQTPVYTDFASI